MLLLCPCVAVVVPVAGGCDCPALVALVVVVAVVVTVVAAVVVAVDVALLDMNKKAIEKRENDRTTLV